ncbi:hypothetical protein JOC85_002673 [Bacillus mesophilus]|uniref:Uncharacterized protein n=1 Tax=Bacillus mesophilus TaxID=1808955 RepID=A0A6M0Q8S1_9BACI|nr:hypothetical protein [Bacillus mesophilus]MBM7661866.1 hypothetical protein [Bacillus mesophilus]NEY72771.1 hypothetical protein [Bacillus mesophilus]
MYTINKGNAQIELVNILEDALNRELTLDELRLFHYENKKDQVNGLELMKELVNMHKTY